MMPLDNIVETVEPRRELMTTATPSDLLRMAVEQGADLDRLERLMALQTQWEAKQAKRAFSTGFAAFKAEAIRVLKERTVTDGPLKGKSYAELYSVVDAVTPALSRHGLSSSWKLTKDDKDWIEVTCTLEHVDGHSESVSMGGPPDTGGAKNILQARCSTVSYLQRYTLKAICGVAEGGEDDDGNGGKNEAIPPELLGAARDAAMQGWKSFAEWIKSLTPEEREQLKPESDNLKRAAKAADQQGQA